MTTTTSLRDTSRQDSLLDLISLMNLSILIYGQGQMVWEVTRNLTLIGVKSITVVSPISSSPHQFNQHAFNTIQNLNPECKITLYSQPLSFQDFTKNLIPQHKLCILVNIFNQKDIVSINEACHNHSPEPIGFLYGCNLGLCGNIFVDFGAQFLVNDPYKSQRTFPIMDLTVINSTGIEITTEDFNGLIRSGKSIKLKGFTFKISKASRDQQNLTVITLEVPSDFTVDKKSCINFELLVDPKLMKFESFKDSLSNFGLLQKGMEGPQKLPSKTLHHLFLATLAFNETFQRLPSPSDHPQFLALYQEASLQADLNKEIFVQFLENLSCEFPPIASLFGALLANEALKISGTYIPLQQWLHFEEFFCAQNPKVYSLDPLHKISQPFISSNIFPEILSNNTLKNFKVFVIGAGALGCEDLRLLAAMNACTGAQGKIYIADFDTISKSNLHRQALYGPHDVNKPKSLVASHKIIEYNPHWKGKIEAFNCPVDNANLKTFPDEFWESLDVIIAAVDGVPARHFLQSQAKIYKKVFINAGTDGVRCSTGIYLPDKSEIYTGKESQGEATPSCTLKDHPYKIEHMIQYGCDRFKEIFVEEVKGIRNAIQSIQDFDLEELDNEDFDLDFEFNRSDLKNLIEMINTPNYPLTKAYSILKGETYDNIKETITKFPRDSKDDHGNLIWRAPRRFPTPIELTSNNPTHIDLIKFTANILAMSFGNPQNYTEQDITAFLENPQKMFIFESNKDQDFIAYIKQLKAKITEECSLSTDLITFTEFDKDDDTRFHMDFLEAFTTVRAANYGIGTTTRDKIRSFAGKITPNMIITTSFAVSLTMLEVFKYSLGLGPEVFRGYHCNLAHGRFLPRVLGENSPVEYNEKLAFKPWDVIEIQGRKIGEIVKEIEEKYGVKVGSLKSEVNDYEVYYKKGEAEELMNEDLEEQESVKEMIENGGKYVWLKVEVEKKRKEVVNGEFPVVKYVIKGREKEKKSWKNLWMLGNYDMNQCSVAPNP